jgi:hypothetical protein
MQSGQASGYCMTSNGILCLAKDEDWFLFREAQTESMANVGGTFVGAGMCNEYLYYVYSRPPKKMKQKQIIYFAE